jgi:ribose transport system substrate-binding protein
MRSHFLAAIAMAAMFVAGPALAQDAPDFLKAPLKKPLKEITIGLSFDLVNPYGTVYDTTFKSFTEGLGLKTVILDSQGDVTRQPNNIRDLIAQQVDAIIVLPSNAKTVIPAVSEAHAAGIPVVISNSVIDPAGEPYIAAFSGPNQYITGLHAGELLAEALGGKGNVVLITGNPGGSASIEREKGNRDALAKFPDIKILDSQPSDWKREKAQAVTEAYFSRFGNTIDGLIGADDGVALGALNAIDAAVASGKIDKDKIKVTSGNVFSAGYDAIKAGGIYYGSSIQAPEEDARSAIRTALKVIEGEDVPKKVFFDTPKFTKETIDQYPRPAI